MSSSNIYRSTSFTLLEMLSSRGRIHSSFTGKERDEETGYGYFGARYYDPTLLTSWTAVDPMSDKYPSLSPYAYCAWNPVKLVDLDGRDVWEVSNDGRIKKTSEKGGLKQQTVIYANEHIVKFQGDKYHQVMLDLSKESDNSVSTSYGNSNMQSVYANVFKSMADNTNVEWAQLLLGESGENGLNVISTSHEIDRNQAATFLIENKYKYGYTIRGSIHNHPNNTPYPSGLTSPGGDIAVAKYLCKISNKNGGGQPFFKIYTPKNGKYIKYNQNSLPSDFSYFMCRSVIISKKQ